MASSTTTTVGIRLNNELLARLDALVGQQTGATRSSLARELLERGIEAVEADKAPSKSVRKGRKPPALATEQPLKEWAEGVLAAARTIPPRKRPWEDRALVCRVHTAWAKAGGPLDLDTFKERLVEANRARYLSLVAADMAPVMVDEGQCTQNEIQDSEIRYLSATFHLLCL